jgi:deazaflavin-dependent oxidoreductase (nitroreductase family)
VIHVVVWRAHWQPGIDALRWFHKRVRPMELRSAGRHGKSTAAVHHTGRTSGKNYVTPVWAHRVGERFLIGLPYGTGVDWCRNVVAADGCALEYDGMRFDVVDPVVVPAAEALASLAGSRRSMLAVMGIEFFLRLDVALTTNGRNAARAADALPAQGDPLSAVAGR